MTLTDAPAAVPPNTSPSSAFSHRRRLWATAGLFAVALAVAVGVHVFLAVPGSVTGPAQGLATELRGVSGVERVDLTYTTRDPAVDRRDPAGWRVRVVVRVESFQDPSATRNLAGTVLAAADRRHTPFTWDLWLVETQEGTGSTARTHLDAERGPSDAADAATLLGTDGVTEVVIDAETAVRTRGPETMVGAARTAAAAGIRVDRLTAGGGGGGGGGGAIASYEGTGVVDVAAVELVVLAAEREGVTGTRFTGEAGGDALDVTVSTDALVRPTADLLRDVGHADLLGRPVDFTVRGPRDRATGAVSGRTTDAAPEGASDPDPGDSPTPAPAPSSDGATSDDDAAWPADPSAPQCTEADLDVAIGGIDAAAGSRALLLTATNVSGRACAVEGHPDVTFLRKSGTVSDVTLVPRGEEARVVVPTGAAVRAELRWGAMSTANDPDVTTGLLVLAAPEAYYVRLPVTDDPGGTGGIDVLDGGTVDVGPWAQRVEGWG